MEVIKKRKRAPRDKSKDYVSGPELHKEILNWYELSKDNEIEPPEKVVLAIYQICDRLSTRRNFGNYTYNDEMLTSGVVSCIAALMQKKYDPHKGNNPFAYFTKIAWNAFIQVIKDEHKEVYIKHKMLENHVVESSLMGYTIELERDESGRLDALVEKFEGNKNDDSKAPDS